MDPITATGLVSIGERIVSNIIQSRGNKEVESFSQYMPQQGTAPTGMIAELLQQNNVQDASDVKMLTDKLSNQLYNHPELAEQLAKMNPEEPLTLKLKDGQFTIESSKGTIAVLKKDSEMGMLAEQIHQLKSIETLHQQVPSSSVYQLAGKVAAEPVLNANWVLRA
jgi:hypothetical protein